MIKAAIVGLGWWGKTLVDAVHGKSDKIQFVAANTRTRAKAEDFCKEKKLDLRDDLDAILKDSRIDAVVYATPHSMHEEHIKRAAAAGKHIYVEKPFALNVKSGQAALDAVKKAGVVLGVDFQRRFHPSVGEIRKRIKEGSLGTISCAVGELSSPGALALPKESWRTNPEESPAGAMTGLGVHLMDGFIDLIGDVDEVYCVNTRRAAPLVDDTTLFIMKHKNGIISTSHCTQASAPSYCLAVFGTEGIAETVRPALDTFRFIPKPGGQPETKEHKGVNPLTLALEAFADACSGKAKFPVTHEQIIHGVAVFEAIVQSASTGKPVKVQ